MKLRAEVVKKETVKSLIAFGDVSHLPLDQLNAIVESVSGLPAHTQAHNPHSLSF